MRKRKWTTIVLIGCVIALVAYGISRCSHRHQKPSSGGTPDPRRAACLAVHGLPQMADIPVSPLLGDCPNTGCGLNGSWLGSGVQFRTLHVTEGTPNPQGLAIRSFVKGNETLIPMVDPSTDELYGIGGGAQVRDQALVGTVLTIAGVFKDIPHSYQLTIKGVTPIDYWASCDGCSKTTTPLYTFTATADDGCEVALCAPGLNDDYTGSLSGNAVIFRGDVYNDANYTVADQTGSDDTFNIVCLGTAISKLHLLRHTNASHPGTPDGQAQPQRQSMLRLLTADYCGTGHPFTIDGLPIRMKFDAAKFHLSSDAGYDMTGASSIDAAWDDAGAKCIDTPRGVNIPGNDLATLKATIRNTCPGHALPDCAPNVTLGTPFGLGNYGVSGNP